MSFILKGARQVGKTWILREFGKRCYGNIAPMNFTGSLLANGDENLAKYLETLNTFETISDAFFNPLHEKLKTYYGDRWYAGIRQDVDGGKERGCPTGT